MQLAAQINTTQLTTALRSYKLATNKSEPEILNRAGRNLAFRAAQNTPVASAAKIRRDLMSDPHLRFAITSLALRKKGIGKLKSPEFAKAVAKLVSRRASSARYLRAGWANAIEQLGGTFRGAKFRGAEGFANKADTRRLITQIVNIISEPDSRRAQGAEAIGLKAMQAAVDFVAEDMRAYAQNILDGHARAISSR